MFRAATSRTKAFPSAEVAFETKCDVRAAAGVPAHRTRLVDSFAPVLLTKTACSLSTDREYESHSGAALELRPRTLALTGSLAERDVGAVTPHLTTTSKLASLARIVAVARRSTCLAGPQKCGSPVEPEPRTCSTVRTERATGGPSRT